VEIRYSGCLWNGDGWPVANVDELNGEELIHWVDEITSGDEQAIAVALGLLGGEPPDCQRPPRTQCERQVAENLRWLDPNRTDTAREVLEQEGVRFDDAGHA